MSRSPLVSTALALLVALGCSAIPEPRPGKYHPSDAVLSVTRIVHASVILELGGARVLVNPWFHAGWLVRQSEALGLVPDTLPPIDLVAITGDTPEQLDRAALVAMLARPPVLVAPPRLVQELTELGFPDVRALGPWDNTMIGPLTVTALPTSRGPRENGYILEASGVRALVAGDTRPFPALVDVATAFPGVDVALLPIGGERSFGFVRQMTPAEAATAAVLLKPKVVIPVAYGTASVPPLWWSQHDAVNAFVDAATAAGVPRDHIVPLEPGESWHYYPPTRR